MTFTFAIEFDGAMNDEALKEQIQAIYSDCEGFVYDGKQIRINFAQELSSKDLAAVSEVVKNHDASVPSARQAFEKNRQDLIVQLGRELQGEIIPVRFAGDPQLHELALRIYRIELALGASGQIASGTAAPAGDSEIKG